MANNQNVSALSLTKVPGVGPAIADKLTALGISSAMDLLFHLPLKYQDRTQVQAIAAIQNGASAVIEGEVRACDVVFGKRRSLLCKIQDGTGTITLRFFHFSAAQKNNLVSGQWIRCYGEASLGRGGLELIHPEYKLITPGDPLPTADYLTAIYPTTEGISQTRWRNYISAAFKLLDASTVPSLIADKYAYRDSSNGRFEKTVNNLYSTLYLLHFPPPDIDLDLIFQGLHPLQRHLAFEELVAQRISHLVLRQNAKVEPAIAISHNKNIETTFLKQLPFSLTNAQKKVLQEIQNDIAMPSPMMRLLQGDVGSGKTIVAAIAALQFISQNQQVVLMAPTEILAEQHLQTFSEWFAPLNITVSLLVSKLPAAEKRQRLEVIASGEAKLVIGTHALIQDTVQYNNLGMIIIDEQHRFGVDQRKALKDKRDDGLSVHQLVMTATPIPRTLAMTFYADLDYSVIDELPPGRTPVETAALSNDRRMEVIERVNNACREGRQVYWICTLIEESEDLQCQAAETTAEELSALLPDLHIGLVHGRLKSKQKQTVMSHFSGGDIQLLVATTVVEVGVNVPNASLMIIENPERLGLSQLHQLRGRVGRGNIKSHCLLMYQKPLSLKGKQRIEIMRATNDGFKLAQQDLQMRGPGQVLGTRQSGAAVFRLADLDRDSDMIDAVVQASDGICAETPNIANALIHRWCPLAANYIDV